MKNINIGSYVGRKKYNKDIAFRVSDIITNADNEEIYMLRGAFTRIIADTHKEDLENIDIKDYEEPTSEQLHLYLSSLNVDEDRLRQVKILYIDADSKIAKSTTDQFDIYGLNYNCYVMSESQQPSRIRELLEKHNPSVTVITGHDNIKRDKDITSLEEGYVNSKYFYQSTKIAREFNPNVNDMFIITGACATFYEKMMEAGANCATSTSRINISSSAMTDIIIYMVYYMLGYPLPIKTMLDSTIHSIYGFGIELPSRINRKF